MPRLNTDRLELVARLLFAGKNVYDASRGAGYPDDASSFAPNARKRANRPDVRARVAELQERAAYAAEVNKTYLLLRLRELLEANIGDYLDEFGNLNVSQCTHEQKYLLQEIASGPNGQFRIKLHDKIAIIAQMARTAGLDREQRAGVGTGIGIGARLAAALKRASESAASEDAAGSASAARRPR
jgi:hypothetical protein